MSVLVVTPPAAFVTLDEAKAHLRVDDNDEDTLITALVAAACAHLDGPNAWLGRALGVQTLEMRQDEFGWCPIRLRGPPIISITSVKYLDADEDEQTVTSSNYVLRTDGALALAVSANWPAIGSGEEPVRIRYQAGYATGGVPAPIKAAALLMLGDLYENRETVVVGAAVSTIPISATVEKLVAPYRVFV